MDNNGEQKIVFIDGNLNTGNVRSIHGRIINEDESLIKIKRLDGTLTIGKNFIIKIEEWKSVVNKDGRT